MDVDWWLLAAGRQLCLNN